MVRGGGPTERVSALMSGAVDVTILTSPGKFIAIRQGYSLFLSFNQFVKGFPTEVFTSFPQFLKENPETIKAFLRANNKAIEIIKTNQDKALAAIKKHVKLTEEDALLGYQALRDSYPIAGYPPLDGIDLTQEIAIMGGEMKNKFLLTDLIDFTYINMFKK